MIWVLEAFQKYGASFVMGARNYAEMPSEEQRSCFSLPERKILDRLHGIAKAPPILCGQVWASKSSADLVISANDDRREYRLGGGASSFTCEFGPPKDRILVAGPGAPWAPKGFLARALAEESDLASVERANFAELNRQMDSAPCEPDPVLPVPVTQDIEPGKAHSTDMPADPSTAPERSQWMIPSHYQKIHRVKITSSVAEYSGADTEEALHRSIATGQRHSVAFPFPSFPPKRGDLIAVSTASLYTFPVLITQVPVPSNRLGTFFVEIRRPSDEVDVQRLFNRILWLEDAQKDASAPAAHLPANVRQPGLIAPDTMSFYELDVGTYFIALPLAEHGNLRDAFKLFRKENILSSPAENSTSTWSGSCSSMPDSMKVLKISTPKSLH